MCAHSQRYGKHVRLQGMLLTANGDSIMQTQYKYDPVDNILGISNVITPKAPKKLKGFGGSGRTGGMGGPDAGKEKEGKPLGGAFSPTCACDELNRLIFTMDIMGKLKSSRLLKSLQIERSLLSLYCKNQDKHSSHVRSTGQRYNKI